MNTCWCWRLGLWDEFGEGRLGEKNLLILMDEVRERREDHSRFCATETRGVGFGRERRRDLIYSQLTGSLLQKGCEESKFALRVWP